MNITTKHHGFSKTTTSNASVESYFAGLVQGKVLQVITRKGSRGLVSEVSSVTPTHLGGFKQWLEIGRCVRKGEKSIRIFGFSSTEDADGNTRVRFPSVAVFDVSQTDALDETTDALPVVAAAPITAPQHAQNNPSRNFDRMIKSANNAIDRANAELSKERTTNTRRRLNIAKGIIEDNQRTIEYAGFSVWCAENRPNVCMNSFSAMRQAISDARYNRNKNAEFCKAWQDYQSNPTQRNSEYESAQRKLKLAGVEQSGAGIDFFPTSERYCKELAALIPHGIIDVLEPSCGHGNMIEALLHQNNMANVTGLELSRSLADACKERFQGFDPLQVEIRQCDFSTEQLNEKFDVVLMNPPFSADIEHIQKAYEQLKEGGKLIAICGVGSFMESKSKARAFLQWLDSIKADATQCPEYAFDTTKAKARLITATKGN